MVNRSFIHLCTAAFAGSIVGIAYERLPPMNDWSLGIPSVSASSSSITGGNRNDAVINDLTETSGKIPEVNVKVGGENFKASAKYGLPSRDNLRIFNDFILSYDRRLRSPAWVIEHLTPEKLRDRELTNRNRSRFFEDSAIHEYFRAKNDDFLKSGYDRGHMAAAANHKLSQEDLDQTFAYSNISPQWPEFNRGAWEKLERYVRYLAKRSKELYVVSGPLYLPLKARDGNLYVTYKVIGSNHVSVPTHYFKVILYESEQNRMTLEAFLMPNDNRMDDSVSINEYRIPIQRLDIIERASGVIFFDQLTRNKVDQPRSLVSGFKDDRKLRKRLSDPETARQPPPPPLIPSAA